MAIRHLARYSTHSGDEMQIAMTDIDVRRKRALFRAQRRGFRELDLIFGAFADAHLFKLDADQLARFEALLSIPDWQIFGWIMGNEMVPHAYDDDIFALLCAYRANLRS
jgi:antitoxin CptB